jgi:hypothetical protein
MFGGKKNVVERDVAGRKCPDTLSFIMFCLLAVYTLSFIIFCLLAVYFHPSSYHAKIMLSQDDAT